MIYFPSSFAWGKVAEEAGLRQAATLGIACATFGLIAGGLIGGPISERLIKKNNLSGQDTADTVPDRTNRA